MNYRLNENQIINYLLSDHTPESQAKSHFFRAMGYTPEDWRALEHALLLHPQTAALESVDASSPFGMKFVFTGDMPPAPDGQTYPLRTVWQARDGFRWFLTGYPQPIPAPESPEPADAGSSDS